MKRALRIFFARVWNGLRALSGDDAYECYLAHYQTHRVGDRAAPLGRKDFYAAEQNRKWSGVRRCC